MNNYVSAFEAISRSAPSTLQTQPSQRKKSALFKTKNKQVYDIHCGSSRELQAFYMWRHDYKKPLNI